MIPTETFGQRLRQMRNEKGWTLREMAQRVNSNFAYLSQIEAGLVTASEDLLDRIATVFGLRGNEKEEFIFTARNIQKQIKEIKKKFPNVAPDYFRRASKKEPE